MSQCQPPVEMNRVVVLFFFLLLLGPFFLLAASSHRVFEGRPALQGAYPWHGALYLRANDKALSVYDRQLCGCSLLPSRQHVLTAAHCVLLADANFISSQKLQQPLQLSVLLDVVDITLTLEEARSEKMLDRNFDVVSAVIYPEYDPALPFKDFAVLKLDRAVDMYIPPVVLDETENSDNWTGTSLRFLGWGQTTYEGHLDYSPILLENDILAQSSVECQRAALSAGGGTFPRVSSEYFRQWLLCAKDDPIRGGLGRGDSGGPLFYFVFDESNSVSNRSDHNTEEEVKHSQQPTKVIQVGVASWGMDYWEDGGLVGSYPNAWAYVGGAWQWIMEQIKEEEDGSGGSDGQEDGESDESDSREEDGDGGEGDGGSGSKMLPTFHFLS
ncbi:Serine protease 53 [Balamuthia mandrillaris]